MENKKLNQFVVFKIGKETYALNTSFIVRIENDKKVRPVPNVKDEIKGIITVEEDIVPLVDLRTKFEIDSKKKEKIPFIIVCKMEEQNIVVGFIVDEVIEVIEMPEDTDLGNISESITGNATEYIQGIYRPDKEKEQKGESKNDEELLIILNVNKLLGLDTMEEIKDIQDKE